MTEEQYLELVETFKEEELPDDYGFYKNSSRAVRELLEEIGPSAAKYADAVRSFETDLNNTDFYFQGITIWGLRALAFIKYAREVFASDDTPDEVIAVIKKLFLACYANFKTPLERLVEKVRDAVDDARRNSDSARDELDYLDNRLDAIEDHLEELEDQLKELKQPKDEQEIHK